MLRKVRLDFTKPRQLQAQLSAAHMQVEQLQAQATQDEPLLDIALLYVSPAQAGGL